MMKYIQEQGQTKKQYLRSGEQDATVFVNTIKKWRPSYVQGKKILDYGCGHGRITRYFPHLLQPSLLVVADVWKSAINFCAKEFNAVPFLISKDNTISKFDTKFDVIMSMSVFSHLPPTLYEFYLDDLKKSLNSNGILLFSVKGEYLANQEGFSLENGFHYEIYPVPNETNGRLSGDEYAVMCVNPSYVENLCKKLGLRILEHKEVCVRRQDLYVVEAI